MSVTTYIERHYEGTFESVYEALAEMARRNPRKARHHIGEVLKSLYVLQGNDWSGRGIVSDTSIDASIAAHECMLAELAARSRAKRGRSERNAGKVAAPRPARRAA